MKNILLFSVPPLAGALIGFVTNVIAIRMLFRPLREIRVFGVRLPFTPGILPRQRRRLADSIGGMVERELLTADLLRQRLDRPEFREKIKAPLSRFTERILAVPLGQLPGSNAEFFTERFRSEAEKRYALAADSFIRFLRRGDIRRELEFQGRIFLSAAILKLNVFQRFFLSAAQYDMTLNQRMPEIIDDLIDQIERLLYTDSLRKKLLGIAAAALDRMFRSSAAAAQSLGDLLNLGAKEKRLMDDFIAERLLRAAGEQIEDILASLDVRGMVADRINSLDMLRVEQIILDVMANQLKWIDVFGAILGFIIGLSQALFSRLLG